MKLLSDQGTPVPLRRHLHPHTVDTASEPNWSALENGELIAAAESNGYDFLITTDRNLCYQQNLDERKIGIIVLLNSSWPQLQRRVKEIADLVNEANPGEYLEI
jgi:hypothetical protein